MPPRARTGTEPPCPQQDSHTDSPSGYLSWHEWAERMSATHRQRCCPGCGLYAIWEPTDGTTPPIDPASVGGCVGVRINI
jgi:hypothetical protein